MRTLMLCCAVFALLAMTAYAETSTLADVLAGKVVPLTLKVKDLDGTWRKLRTSAQANGAEGFLAMVMAMQSGGQTSRNVCYTKGQTLVIDGVSYLVAYTPPSIALDPRMMMRGGEDMPQSEPLTADSNLALSLLSLRDSGSLCDIQPFDPAELQQAQKAQEEANAKSLRPQSQNNLRQLAIAVLMYTQDHDEKLPDMKDAAALKKAINVEEKLLVEPASKQPYLFNTVISGRSLGSIKNPSLMVIVYEAQPDADGMRAAAFMDGHVALLDAEDWAMAKSKSGLW